MIKVILIFLSTLSITAGCVVSEVKREYRAENNIFSSNSVPEIRVETANDIVFLGNLKDTKSITHERGTSDYTTTYSYIFGRVEENETISKGVMIEIWEIDKGFWYSHAFTKTKVIDSGVEKIDGKNYDYYLVSINPFNLKEQKAIKEWGYRVKNCYLSKVYVRVAGAQSRYKIYVGYFEWLENIPCEKDLNPKFYSEEQKQVIVKFLGNSKSGMQISSIGTEPIKIDSQRKQENVENKLRKLKDLFEQGLITEKEYESKKAEILDNIN